MEYLSIIISVSIAAVVTAVGFYIRSYRKLQNYWKERGVPYEYSWNIVSNLRKVYSKPIHELLLDLHKRLGRIYGYFEFKKPVLTVNEPELLRDILVKDFHIFHYRRDIDNFGGDPIFKKMVSVMKGEDWKRVRTVITPAFTSRKMRHMSHIINQCSKTVSETLSKHEENGKPFDCKGIFGAFTLDVIASAAFATKIDSHNDPENIFVKNAKQAFIEPPFLYFLSFILLPTWLQNLLRLNLFPVDFFKNVVLQVLKERRETGKRYEDILQLLMDAQDENETSALDVQSDETDQYGSVTSNGDLPRLKYKKLYEDEVIAQCILFFLVGYETTASTLSFMAYALALNQECQEKLIKEVDEVYKKHEEVDYDIIRDMKYLDCVVSETLRMYPPLIRTERTASEDYKLGNTGITIEKGTIVGANIHAMHYDPEFFQNPENFDPERFLSENANHHPYAYLPFGAGPRNCLGMRFALMEIKLCMSNILRNYRFKTAETTKIPLEYKKAQGFLSVNELPLLVEGREKSHS